LDSSQRHRVCFERIDPNPLAEVDEKKVKYFMTMSKLQLCDVSPYNELFKNRRHMVTAALQWSGSANPE